MASSELSVLNEEFQNECKVINIKYEYNDFTGDEQWAIISELTETEIIEKYHPLVKEYIPFIVLTSAFGEVRDDFRRNERKHQMRSARSIDSFNYEDGEMEIHHPELILDDFEKRYFKNEDEKALRNAIMQLKPIQKERLIKYYFEDKSTRQIADDEGVSHQAVSNSISSALENLKKILNEGCHFTTPSGNK